MTPNDIPADVLSRRAIVYVRQSTGTQVRDNLESQRRQYALADLARSYGFRDVRTIDEDLGRSGSGLEKRPGFESLVAQVCQGEVGAVFCLEPSRLARNGRDWHHLLELCGLVRARVVDSEGIYDPSRPNDRLLLGLKGTMSEFELTMIRARMVEGAHAKASRGELRIPVPVGYIWERDAQPEIAPDRRIQDSIHAVFRLFEQYGSARQAHLHMCREGILFPRPADGRTLRELQWRTPGYRNIITVLQNPFFAGAYAYGKTGNKTTVVDGNLRKSYGHNRPIDEWTVLLKDHHCGYISWAQYERNQKQIARNAHRRPAGSAKSGRGGKALLSGLLRCGRCGRMLSVCYSGYGRVVARYWCRLGHVMHGLPQCISFGALRPDKAVASEILRAVAPVAVEAALMAEGQSQARSEEAMRALELELEQARYEAKLAARRYEAMDPDNRLVASELEARWNASLQRVRDCEAKVEARDDAIPSPPTRDDLLHLAADLESLWDDPDTEMKTKQRLLRALLEEIVADVDEVSQEVVLVFHWRGGRHSELRVRKAKTGEHTNRASDEAAGVIRSMAAKWPDEHIAATLNRMGSRTGQGNAWNARRVCGYRMKQRIAGYESANKDGKCLTLSEAAAAIDTNMYQLRCLIRDGILPASQVVKDAPWQILATDLRSKAVQTALRERRKRQRRPCRTPSHNANLTIPGT